MCIPEVNLMNVGRLNGFQRLNLRVLRDYLNTTLAELNSFAATSGGGDGREKAEGYKEYNDYCLRRRRREGGMLYVS